MTFDLPQRTAGHGYRRSSQTFPREGDAKAFARGLISTCELTAGTINPHVPKRFIGSHEVADWLDESDEPV